MNVDHKAREAFERKAVAALKSGKEEFEAVEGGRYRRVGSIVLHDVCLQCHLPNRTSRENRTAGLVISMPFGAGKFGKQAGCRQRLEECQPRHSEPLTADAVLFRLT